MDDLNALVTPYLGAIVIALALAVVVLLVLVIVLFRRTSASRAAHRRPHARRRTARASRRPSTPTSTRSTRSRARSTTSRPGRPSWSGRSAGLPAPRARPLQPVRGHRRQPELRARAARPARRRVRRQQPPRAGRDPRLRQGDRAGHVRGRAVRGGGRGAAARARREPGRARAADVTRIVMRPVTPELARAAPSSRRAPSPSTAVDPADPPRPRRVRRRVGREPAALVQIPVWGGRRAALRSTRRRRTPASTQLLAGLNAEQRRAVTHGDGPLLVVAGAGTGKTQVITRRIAWLIATRRARPSEILALTFTDQAADEMQTRVDQLVPYGYTDTAISTFHAFGDRLVREFALELGLPGDVRVLSRPETVVFLREHLFELELDEYRPLGDPTKFLDALATLFSRAKDEDVSPEAFLAHAERLAATAAEARTRSTATARRRPSGPGRRGRARGGGAPPGGARPGVRAYQRLLAANGAIDFGDQVSLALRLLRESPSAREQRPGPVPVRARGRVPGHEPRPVGARRAARAAAPQRDRGGRRRPVDLQVPGRGDQQHPRVPGALPERPGRRAAPQLPVARPDPRRLVPARPPQRPGPARGPRRDRQAARPGAGERRRRRRSATRRSRPARRRRTGSRRTSRAGCARARRTATSRSSSGRTRPRTRSCGRSTSRASRGGSPARAASTPGRRSGCCSRSCGPSRTPARRSTSTRSRRRSCTGSAARTS